MIKKKIFLHSGFTIAELLLSLLVVMVVATALVPIVGPKKVKVPTFNRNNGVFECYYDDNGVLMQYHADLKSRRNNEPQAAEFPDHCEFDVPMANHYELYAIGAGSDSSSLDETKIGYNVRSGQGGSIGGYINIDNWHTSFTDANRYTSQATGISENSLADALRSAFDEWAMQKQRNGSDLYVTFSGLRSPVGAGGSGLSKEFTSQSSPSRSSINCGNCRSYRSNSYNYCRDYSYQNPAAVDTKITSPPYYVRYFQRESDVQPLVLASGSCVWLQHAAGGDSGEGREMLSGYTLYVPVDGDPNGGLTVQFDDEDAKIVTMTHKGTAQIDLRKKAGGEDASDNPFRDGNSVTVDTPSDIFINNDRLFKYGSTGSRLRVMEDSDFNTILPFAFRNKGALYGQTGSGGTRDGDPASYGQANYTSNAFYWSYAKLQAKYDYAKAGKTGEVKVLTFNNMNGKLYMYPAIRGQARTVVANAANPNLLTARLLSAQSGANGNGWQPYASHGWVDVDPETMPFPPNEVVNAATPENDKFGRYIDRIRALGLKKGLYDCKDQGKCPGYAGGGAYPFLDTISGANTLKIQDLQGLNGTYSKDYTLPSAGGSESCPEGMELKTKAQKQYYYDSEGNRQEYDVNYCKSTSKASNGAVILIW